MFATAEYFQSIPTVVFKLNKMIGHQYYEEYLKKCFPKDKIVITFVPKNYLAGTIKVYIANKNVYFNLDGYNNFCGGIFIWGLDTSGDESDALPYLEKTLDYCYVAHQGLVVYITKEKGQEGIVEVLKVMDFEKDYEVFNPNSGNVCIHWHIDLTKRNYQNKK